MSLFLSASSAHRALACVGSVLLPQVGRISGDTTMGNHRHEYLRAVSDVGATAALELIPEGDARDMCAAIDLDGLPLDPGLYAQEVAYVWNVLKGEAREVGRNIGRKYPELAEGEVAGTADSVGLLDDTTVFVGDYKGVDPSTPAAAVNPQMRQLARAAALATGRTRAVVQLLHIRDDGTWWSSRAEFDELDMEAIDLEFRELYETALAAQRAMDADGTEPPLVEGKHCGRCPAFPYCPAKVRLARELGMSGSAMENGPEAGVAFPPLTLEDAPAVLERLELGEKLLAHVRERLEAFARETPIPLPGGEVFGKVRREEEKLDLAKASIILTGTYGEDVARACVKQEPSMTWDLVNKAVGVWAKQQSPVVKLKDAKASVRQLLREKGGINVRVSSSVKRHKPAPVVEALPEGTEPAAPPPEEREAPTDAASAEG